MTETEKRRQSGSAAATLTAIFVAQFLVSLDVSLVNIALPNIAEDLGFSGTGLQWVVSAYLLTFAGFMLLGGRLGDLWGRRRVVEVGLALFALASILGGLAWDAQSLVLARALQGVAGALLAPAALALVTSLPEGTQRRRGMALWGGAGAGGGAVGVVLSGLLTEAYGWRAVMLINVPIVLVGFVAATRMMGSALSRSDRPNLDPIGALLATSGVGILVYAVTSSGESGWVSVPVVLGCTVALLLLSSFVFLESRVNNPLMPLRLFDSRSMVGANLFGFMLSAGQLAAFYFASLHIQNVWGVSAGIAGFMFVPFCVFVGVGIALATKSTAAVGPRITLALFGVIGAVGLAGFAAMPDATAFWTGVFIPSIFGGIGIGGSMIALGSAATAGVASADAGIASGVLNASRLLGGTVGLAVLVTIAASVTENSTAGSAAAAAGDGYRIGLGVGAVFLLVGSVLAYVIVPKGAMTASTDVDGAVPDN
ncbi:MAG: MFS transporter [Rhodococcus sp. (in: high G+C Gram-positive bacteria)]|uniref:MFS transporter n=1 Tax=Rhodococcus sp. TaxID=1831 RepID=UPI002AD6723A|nr:MFS transporter [Rhodococcus sp. (in: high G+C Gram-positive bacteria)]